MSKSNDFPQFKDSGPTFGCHISMIRLDWHHRNNGEKYLVPRYEQGLFDLVCSIRESGVQQPICVCWTYGPLIKEYTLVDGYMRVLASIALGLKTIPAQLLERVKADDSEPK